MHKKLVMFILMSFILSCGIVMNVHVENVHKMLSPSMITEPWLLDSSILVMGDVNVAWLKNLTRFFNPEKIYVKGDILGSEKYLPDGVQLCANQTNMFDPQIAMVIISAQSPFNNAETIAELLQKGKHVFLEKTKLTSKELLNLSQIAFEQKCGFVLGYTNLFEQTIQKLAQVLPEFGYIHEIEISLMYQDHPTESLGAVEELLPELLTTLYALLGEKQVSCLKIANKASHTQVTFKYGVTDVRIDIAHGSAFFEHAIIVKTEEYLVMLDCPQGSFDVKTIQGDFIKRETAIYLQQLLTDLNSSLLPCGRVHVQDFFQSLRRVQDGKVVSQGLNHVTNSGWISDMVALLLDPPDKMIGVMQNFFSTGRNGGKPISFYPTYDLIKVAPFERVDKFLDKKPLTYPKRVEFHVGTSCLGRCRFCYRRVKDGKLSWYNTKLPKLTPRQYTEIIHDLANNGTEMVIIAGGLEPLSDIESLIAIIRTAKARGLEVILLTNALTSDKNWDLLLADLSNVDTIRVSLHAATSTTYQKIVFPDETSGKHVDTFEGVCARIRKLREYRDEMQASLRIGISFLITPENFHEIDTIVSFAHLGLDFLDFRCDYLNISKALTSIQKQKLCMVFTEIVRKIAKGSYNTKFHISLPENFMVIGDRVVLKNIEQYDLSEYSSRGVYAFGGLTISPHGEVYATSTAANPGIKDEPCGKENLLGNVIKRGDIGRVMNYHVQKGTTFTVDPQQMNAFTTLLLLYIENVRRWKQEQDKITRAV